MKLNTAKLEQKLICGKLHYRRRCNWCDELVWTQDTKLPTYVCNTCSHPKYGSTCGTGEGRGLAGEWNGSADDGVKALEG